MPARIDPVNVVLLLGLLDENPRNGYELKRNIDERLQGLVGISIGALYYTLKQLEDRRWIRGTVSRGKRGPDGKTYRLTAAGRRGFHRLLKEAAHQPDRLYSPFDVALYFAPKIDPLSLRHAVDRRLDELNRNRDRIRRIEEMNPGRWPYYLYYLREKTKENIDLQERWSRRLKKKIEEKFMPGV